MRSGLVLLISATLVGAPVSAVDIDWVAIGDPGNACDPDRDPPTNAPPGCFGGVGYTYQIGRYEVTNAEYAEFLNAVAQADPDPHPHNLYHTWMGDPSNGSWGGITRTGEPGSYSYSLIPGRENMPVSYVNFWKALRFANWLHNGQPSGPQGAATTQDGSYTLSLVPEEHLVFPRNPEATVVVPTEDEWYKAAHYDPLSRTYFAYPTASDEPPTCTAPGATPNTANCGDPEEGFTPVGSYGASASPNGTFDQGGNAIEWTETLYSFLSARITRGSSFRGPATALWAGLRTAARPTYIIPNFGFRVARLLPDADADGIPDEDDNCIEEANGPLSGPSDQVDSDGDGYGNVCDCDFDNSGYCNATDLNLFLPEFAQGADSGIGSDMTGNGVVNADDFNLFLPGFASGVPGPSGVAP